MSCNKEWILQIKINFHRRKTLFFLWKNNSLQFLYYLDVEDQKFRRFSIERNFDDFLN